MSLPWPSDAHRDAAVYFAQAAATGPPWLAIALGVIALLGVIATATGPALAERMKRGQPPASTTAAPAVPPAVEGPVDLVREIVADLRRERDEAQERADRLADELAEERRASAVKDVELARRDARIEALVDRLERGPR
ncbi:hypothetical protein [Saccharothrix xinjiangensis]|uniref:Uncharacterized protein n=1 Tax=Saccharothrix xinjiangensis TaxID=204798 RepID=A0ABV9XWR9_9PSEU